MEPKLERRLSKELNSNELKKNFKDIDNIDDFDFDKIDLLKGETPDDIKEKCLKLCQDYLSGNWCRQTQDTIEVRRISGGLTNQLYYCGIIDKSTKEEVPQEVAIRLYGPKYFDSCDNDGNERLSDVVIGLMVSETNLGPKIYGVFEEGQIHRFYKHRQFRDGEQNNLETVRQVVHSLARIHAMDVPIKKNTNWLYKYMLKCIDDSYRKFPFEKELQEYNCKTLMSCDLKKEINWMKDLIDSMGTPIVFTHNDFRSSNLMITEPNDELVVCDFEYAGYGYRGHDFVNLMREWGRNPFDFKSIEGLPPKDTEFRPLIEMYVQKTIEILGKSYAKNPINSVDSILREVKIFLLNNSLFGTVFLMKNDETNHELPLNRKLSMEFAEICFTNYFTLKEKLIDENVINV